MLSILRGVIHNIFEVSSQRYKHNPEAAIKDYFSWLNLLGGRVTNPESAGYYEFYAQADLGYLIHVMSYIYN